MKEKENRKTQRLLLSSPQQHLRQCLVLSSDQSLINNRAFALFAHSCHFPRHCSSSIAKIPCLKLHAPLTVQSLPWEWLCNNLVMTTACICLSYSPPLPLHQQPHLFYSLSPESLPASLHIYSFLQNQTNLFIRIGVYCNSSLTCLFLFHLRNMSQMFVYVCVSFYSCHIHAT